jgi:hypothetical protein
METLDLRTLFMKFQILKNFQNTYFKLLKYSTIDEGENPLRCAIQDEKHLVLNAIVFYICIPINSNE